MAKVKFLTQVRIITKEDFEFYLKDFPEESNSFQDYINLELGLLFDEKHTVISVSFLTETTVVIIYNKRI